MAKKNYYAVRKGFQPGIYETWLACEKQVKGFSGAEYKGFQTRKEAIDWLEMKDNRHIKPPVKSVKDPGAGIRSGKNIQVCSSRVLPEQLNEEQKAAFDLLCGGENVFLTGEAGTGKSFLLRCFLDVKKKEGRKVIVCAPTGIAAIQIHGATLHRTFQLKVGPILPGKQVGKVRDVIKAADIIVIDEISMCRFDIFEYVCRYIKKAEELSKKAKQLIVVGDFCQLAPVMRSEERLILEKAWQEEVAEIGAGFAFVAPAWKCMRFQPIFLHKIMRQKGDPDFVSHLNQIRSGDSNAISWFNEHTSSEQQPGVFMYGTNRLVDIKNQKEIENLQKETRLYLGKKDGFEGDLPVSEKLILCEGARVMSVINDASGNYQNGSLGTVWKLDDQKVVVRFDNGKTEEMKPFTWQAIDYQIKVDKKTGSERLVETVIGEFTQIPLKIAFAVTIHKSQGQTYDSANLDPACFGEGQLYVALSRVVCSEVLHLTRPIQKEDLKVSPDVTAFYENLLTNRVTDR
ncbi:MAG: viroplasmin family protein [Clostridiales bacterium]|nr:viroplasmin family protein [Clostridiales bacterium]